MESNHRDGSTGHKNAPIYNESKQLLTTPPLRKKLYSSMLSLLAFSMIFTHIWNEKRSLCLSNNPRHVYLKD